MGGTFNKIFSSDFMRIVSPLGYGINRYALGGKQREVEDREKKKMKRRKAKRNQPPFRFSSIYGSEDEARRAGTGTELVQAFGQRNSLLRP
jgi:hypothetical protein